MTKLAIKCIFIFPNFYFEFQSGLEELMSVCLYFVFYRREMSFLINECLFLQAYLIELCLMPRLQNSLILSKFHMKYKINVFTLKYLVLLIVTKHDFFMLISLLLILQLYLSRGFFCFSFFPLCRISFWFNVWKKKETAKKSKGGNVSIPLKFHF